MKISLFSLPVYAVALCFVVSSCKQTDYNANVSQTNSSDIETLTKNMKPLSDALKTSPQTFTVSAGTPQTIHCSSGTSVGFSAASFKDANGNVITGGSVNVQIVEMYKPGDMISNHASTITADGNFLQSSGQVNIQASVGGQAVYANKYTVSFKGSGNTTAPMSLYYATKNSDSILTWTIADTTKKGATAVLTPDFMYIFDTCTKFGYVNCDRLPADSGSTTIFIAAPDSTYTVTNTQIFLVLPSLNSFVQNRIASFNEATHTFKFGDDGSNVPVGMDFEIVMITNKNGNYYFFDTTGKTTVANVTLKAAPISQTLPYIVSKIKAL